MSKFFSIARPYANAILVEANNQHQLNEWQQLLEVLARIIEQPEVRQWIINPKLSAAQTSEFFFETAKAILPKIVISLNERVKNFLTLLAAENRLTLLPEIAVLYHQLLLLAEKVLEASVTSAFKLSEQQQALIQKELEKRFKKRVNLHCTQDSSLIGGAIIRIGDWVLDGSVSGKLAALQQKLA